MFTGGTHTHMFPDKFGVRDPSREDNDMKYMKPSICALAAGGFGCHKANHSHSPMQQTSDTHIASSAEAKNADTKLMIPPPPGAQSVLLPQKEYRRPVLDLPKSTVPKPYLKG